MTEQIDIEDLRAKLAAATPGPWEGEPEYLTCYLIDGMECEHPDSPLRNSERFTVRDYGVQEDADWHEHEVHDIHCIKAAEAYVAGNYDYEAGGIVRTPDAELIVAAVNALPALLDEIERLRAVTDEQVLAALNATVKPDSAAPDLSYWGEESAAQMRRSLEAARQAGGEQ